MAAHFSILAWKTPWAEEPGGHSPWGRKERVRLSTQHSNGIAHRWQRHHLKPGPPTTPQNKTSLQTKMSILGLPWWSRG